MKTAAVTGLSVSFAVVGAIAGTYGGIYLDRRAGDSYGVNIHANEVALQLKIKSAVLSRLSKGDLPCAKRVLMQTIDLDRKAIVDFRAVASLDKVTLARMDESIDLATRTLSTIDLASPDLRCE